MIAANKNDVLDAGLFLYFKAMARRSFHTIAGRGLDRLRDLPKDRPVILFCNHTNWWDGLIVYLLTSHWFLGADASATHYLDKAANSPITICDTNTTVAAVVGYHF